MKTGARALLTWIFVIALSSMGMNAFAAEFKDDLEFLRRHTEIIVLQDEAGGARVAVAPEYQGRVMTSTAQGGSGRSFGWVNRELIASGETQPHINVFGGEDRFWLGPEGGQFSLFFAKDAPFDLEHWFTPPPIDTEPFETVDQTRDRVRFRKRMTLVNYSGSTFDLEVSRSVRLSNPRSALSELGLPALPAGVSAVGFESINSVKNAGQAPWTRDTGLLSIWILGMFNASPQTTVVVPIVEGPDSELGPAVNDAYFGKPPANRLIVRDGVVFFRGDAKHRSKIGVSPRRAKPFLGSYDSASGALTLVHFTLPEGATDYVNSMWEWQKEPYAGDAANSYNDGPPEAGAEQLGKFYELESSSPALALAPGQSASHVHRTYHLEGGEPELDPIARAALGVGLKEIKEAFSR